MYHRHTDRAAKTNALFGQTFYLQCENEWSTARAGAHILAQAARFLQRPDLLSHGPIDVDDIDESDVAMIQRIYDKAQSTISDLIDLLVECDREYVRAALGVSEKDQDLKGETYPMPILMRRHVGDTCEKGWRSLASIAVRDSCVHSRDTTGCRQECGEQ